MRSDQTGIGKGGRSRISYGCQPVGKIVARETAVASKRKPTWGVTESVDSEKARHPLHPGPSSTQDDKKSPETLGRGRLLGGVGGLESGGAWEDRRRRSPWDHGA